jgi:AcrR family transcriptional regulator
MSEPDRRLTNQGQERRRQLLDAAAELFSERGYQETRVMDICKAAGVAKGLFYWYFESKEEVFRQLNADLRTRLRKEQAAAMDPEADPLVKIRQGSEASVRFMAAHARSFALMAVENVDRQFLGDLRRGTELHADDTERLVVAGIELGLIRDEDPRLLAYSVLTTVGWFAHYHRLGRVDLDVDGLTAFVGRQIVCSLASGEKVVRENLAVPTFTAEPEPV